jgi:hypothetical protein
MIRPVAPLVALLVVALLGTACVRLPDSGPVEVGSTADESSLDRGFPYVPRPPQRGESSVEIVRHFFDAMTASPIQTSVARQFLTASAAQTWRPEERMITYSSVSGPTGVGEVELSLEGASWLDARGTWQGTLPADRSRLSFPMEVEDGEWRISRVPNTMIVSEDWFDDRYERVSLYFFDPPAQILVPEPVFLPRGDQLATSLIRALLVGPPTPLGDAAPSFFPRGAQLDDLSVPVTRDGLADVSLSGDIASMSPESLDLMTAQIAWTLRQDPSVRRVRVSIGDTPVTLSGGSTEFSVELGAPFDPAGAYARRDPFGLRDGRLVSFVDGEETPVTGPFGVRARPVRDLSVDLPGERVAAVSRDGRSLLLGPVESEPGGAARTVVSGADDLLHPAWDLGGRMWLLDRTADGAEVSVYENGRRRVVDVPGVTGREVVDFLVSRDGSRLVAAIDLPGSDQVVVSRIRRDRDRVTPSRAVVIEPGTDRGPEIRDIAWRSPTEVLLVTPLERGLTEIRTLSVDGSPATGSGDAPTEILREDVRRMVSSPVPGRPAWAVLADTSLVQLAPDQSAPAPEGLRLATYVG